MLLTETFVPVNECMIVIHVSGAALADHVHDVPAAPTGAVVRADAVPGRLHQGGARHEAGPQ